MIMGASSGVAFSDQDFQVIVQTDDATPTTVLSVPIRPDSVMKIALDGIIFSLDETKLATGQGLAVFARVGSNNVTRPSAFSGQLQVNNFTAPMPNLNIVANTATQTADVIVTGQPGVSIRWHLDVYTRSTP